MEDLLQQGITAYKAGKRDEARRIFLTVVKQNIDSERAWGWMNNVCKTDQERIHCLKQVLRINPKNEKARQMLDQLLVPTFASDLPLSAVSSVQLSLSPSGAKATSRNSSFTQTQLLILIRLTITVFLIIGFAILYRVGPKNAVVIGPYPTSSVTSSAKLFSTPTEVLSTATLIPTYAYQPTWTPLPSPTSFVVPTLIPPTSKPPPAQGNPAPANPPSSNPVSNCLSQLDFATAMHQYYLDQIDYIHAPLINLYQSWIDEAARNRDALGMVEAQQKLDNENAQVEAEKTAENKRYKAEQANINASCQ